MAKKIQSSAPFSATLQDVAHLAGVSPITVSRVITGSHKVREVTRSKVNRAIAELNYQPNQAARSLAGDRSFLIGTISTRYSSSYFFELHRGAAGACREFGYHLLHEEIDINTDPLDWYAQSFQRTRLKGLIVPLPFSDERLFLDQLEANQVPYVRVAPATQQFRSPSVSSDEETGAAALAEHLWSAGHRRFAIVAGPPEHLATRMRLNGFLSTMHLHGVSPDEVLVIDLKWDGSIINSARHIFLDLGGRLENPLAVFVFNDELAAALIRIAHEHGVRVPQDLAIAGFDGSDIGELTYPSLTTVRQPIAEMAHAAVELLIRGSIAEENPHVVFPVEVIVRDST